MKKDRPKVVITDYGFPGLENERAVIEAAGGELAAFQCKTEADVIEAASDADALLVQWAPITSSVIGKLSHCKVIVRYGIGVDNVDLEAASRHGIAVCNVPDYCIDEVADHTLALALTLIKQLATTDRSVRQGAWKTVPKLSMAAPSQMTFASVGYGRTARAALDRARGFKFNLAACDPYLPPGAEIAPDVRLLTFNELLEAADILSLHMPLTDETTHIINSDTLSRMKSSAFLINTSRGRLIDTSALVKALREGRIAGAGLDVFEDEPLEPGHPLLVCENVVLTSHIAWYSGRSVASLQRKAAEEAVRALNGKTLHSQVS